MVSHLCCSLGFKRSVIVFRKTTAIPVVFCMLSRNITKSTYVYIDCGVQLLFGRQRLNIPFASSHFSVFVDPKSTLKVGKHYTPNCALQPSTRQTVVSTHDEFNEILHTPSATGVGHFIAPYAQVNALIDHCLWVYARKITFQLSEIARNARNKPLARSIIIPIRLTF